MFRGKESSNRIELYRLIQDIEFWCFELPAALGLGGGWMGVGVVGGAPTHVYMHTHACTHMHGKHDNFMQMAAPIGGIPGNPL